MAVSHSLSHWPSPTNPTFRAKGGEPNERDALFYVDRGPQRRFLSDPEGRGMTEATEDPRAFDPSERDALFYVDRGPQRGLVWVTLRKKKTTW